MSDKPRELFRCEGIVSCGDSSRTSEPEGAIIIGDVDVIDEIADIPMPAKVDVWINGECMASGECRTTEGWGYSEYTPMESDEAHVGDFDLIAALSAHEGKSIVFIVAQHVGDWIIEMTPHFAADTPVEIRRDWCIENGLMA